MITSTPNVSLQDMPLNNSDLSIVEQPPSPPLLLTDDSMNDLVCDCTFDCISRAPIKEKTQDTNKPIDKAVNKDDASGQSIEAVECDRDGTKEQNVTSHNEEPSVDKLNRSVAVVLNSNKEVLESDQNANNTTRKKAAEYRPCSHKAFKRRVDKSNVGKKGLRKDSVDVTKTSKVVHCKDAETCTCFRPHESLGALSLADSSASEAARTRSLENKLLATMQILKNKEETVRVQAESLALAEARIAALTAKQHSTLRSHQAQQTPVYSTRSLSVDCRVDMTDASSAADLQGMDNKLVNTLQDNLSVIEELYRECFYESAKQEELITLLRRSHLDLRLMERQRTEQICRLQREVHSQRCSLQQCQSIALEVENLKSEITNFLNNSQNNDSGVWEREEDCTDAAEELRGIAHQLRRLRDMLNTDCTCGLEEENMNLKTINESMEIQITNLRQRISDLEETLENKENLDQRYREQIQDKEKELQRMRSQLLSLEQCSRDQNCTNETLNCKLKQMEVLLKDKSTELLTVQRQCDAQQATIQQLRGELAAADGRARENGQVREEVAGLSAQVTEWREQLSATRRRLRALEDELRRAREHCRHLADRYREKAQMAEQLQSQLQQAQARGAALCGEARRAVCGVRHWLHRQRKRNKDQEEVINQQKLLIQSLQRRGADSSVERTATSDSDPCCSRYLPAEERRSERSVPRTSETGCSKCVSNRAEARTSGSEIASSPPPPTPPRRMLRKKFLCDNRCQCPATRESSAQSPARSQACVGTALSRDHLTPTPDREPSLTDEVLERVERAHEALADAHRRWSRGARDVDR